MSVHPSLRRSKSKKHKSVLKRLEKLIRLQKEEKWYDGTSVLGLPKVKVVKIKIKKEKTKTAEAVEGTTAALPGATTDIKGTQQAAAVKPEVVKKQVEKK